MKERGRAEIEKDMQILWHEDAQGTSRLEQKGDSQSQHQQIQHDLRLGKMNIPFSRVEPRWEGALL